MEKCSQCQNDVGADATSCPKCGQPTLLGRRNDFAKKIRVFGAIWFVVMLLNLVLGIYGGPRFFFILGLGIIVVICADVVASLSVRK